MTTTLRRLAPVDPVVLEGPRVRMEPLDLERHGQGLLAIALEPALWRFTQSIIRSPDDLRRYLDTAAREMAEKRSLPFATFDKPSGRIAGCTRFADIDARDRHVEIGWTWIGRPFQRTYVNTEAKYLMLTHAFETLGCVRVQFKANVLNTPSRNAIERIGGVEEGVLRKQSINDDGVWRDTIYYGILDDDWPAVKARLEAMLAAPPA